MIEMRMKALLFDSPGVQRATDAATRRALNRAGPTRARIQPPGPRTEAAGEAASGSTTIDTAAA